MNQKTFFSNTCLGNVFRGIFFIIFNSLKRTNELQYSKNILEAMSAIYIFLMQNPKKMNRKIKSSLL